MIGGMSGDSFRQLLNLPETAHGATQLAALRARELAHYHEHHPRSAALAQQSATHFFAGVPLHWMADWPIPFPLFVATAHEASLLDVDGHRYADFCLGDTGAMFGHSPEPIARALAAQTQCGLTTMLPHADTAWVGRELSRRFGLQYWQIATTASDANRFALRWARAVTGRPVVVIFDGCYHGAVDDTQLRLEDGQSRHAPGLVGRVLDYTKTTRVVDFNDLDGLAKALAPGDVAAVLCEPALTNIGMVLPTPGFHRALRELTRQHGTLLIIDETHTISTAPGGYSAAFGLEPDFLVVGKAIAGGLPCAVYGCSAEIAARMTAVWRSAAPGRTGIGTTLSANMLQIRALRANLEEVMTAAAYRRMTELATSLAQGLRLAIARHGLPWSVTQLGARCEFQFRAARPRNGREAEAGFNDELAQIMHLYLLNRHVLITPFHNMTLCCPQTTDTAVAALLAAFDQCLVELRHGPPA